MPSSHFHVLRYEDSVLTATVSTHRLHSAAVKAMRDRIPSYTRCGAIPDWDHPQALYWYTEAERCIKLQVMTCVNGDCRGFAN